MTLLSSDEHLVMDLRRRGIAVEWLGDYSSLDDLNFADEAAFACARGWHQDRAASSVLTYRGINLGSLVELSFGSYLTALLRETIRVQNYLKKNPEREARLARYDFDREVRSFYLSAGETLLKKIFEKAGCHVTEEVISKGFSPKNSILELVRIPKYLVKELLRRVFIRSPKGREISDRKVLFCSAVHHVESVVDRMGADYRLYYLDETFQMSKLQWAGSRDLTYFAFDALLGSRPASLASRQFLETFGECWPGFFESLKSSERFNFLDKNIFALASERMAYFASQKATQLVRAIDVIYDFLEKQKIQAIVVDEDVIEFRRTLVSVAGKLGVRSLVILHATTPSFCGGKDLAPLAASLLAVGGEGIKEDSQRCGIEPERIVVTGVPRYDSLGVLQKLECRDEIEKKYGVRLKKDLVVFASTYINDRLEVRGDWWDIERAYRDFFSVMAGYPEKSLFLKLYPMDEHADWVEGMAAACGLKEVVFSKNHDLMRAMAAADTVVSFQSTAVTEALLLKKPVIVLDYLRRVERLSPLAQAGACPFLVKNKTDLEKASANFFGNNKAFFDQARLAGQSVAESWAGKCDGRASERVAQIIAESLIS